MFKLQFIKTKLILAITLTFVVVSVVGTTVFLNVRSKHLTDHELAQLGQLVDYTHGFVESYLHTGLSALENASQNPIYLTALSPGSSATPASLALVRDDLTLIQKTSQTFEGLALMSKDCVLLGGPDNLKSLIGRDFSSRDYCKGVRAINQSYISTAFVSALTNHVVISLAVPIKNTDGQFSGFVTGGIDVGSLRGYLVDLQKTGYAVLLDRNGSEFLDTRHTTEKIITSDGQILEVKTVNERIANGQTNGSFEQIGLSGQSEYVVYRQYPNFTVIKGRPTSVVLSQVKEMILYQGITIFLELIAIIFLLIFLVRKITNKLSRLGQIAKEIAGGKFDIKLEEKEYTVNDETGVLARAFNEMAIKLSSLYRDMDKKVKDRTAELEEKNKQLEASDAELKKSLPTLERTNKLMVDRELKMKEMKKRIEELEGKNPQT